MFNKKILCLDDGRLIALKFCDEKQICVIGGQENMREAFEIVLKDYFGIDENNLPQFRISTKGKGRYIFTCDWDKYKKAVEDLRKDNFTVRDVRTHGKLMR